MRQTKEFYQDFMKEFNPTLIIGEGLNGEYVTLTLKKIVHLLFGGQSGSGKSVFVLQLLFQMIFMTNPDSLKLLLVDPLRVSFKDFKELPHLLAPVANTSGEAIKVIEIMINTSNERYQFLENIGFEDIYQYNEALLKDEIPYKVDGIKKFLPMSEIPEEYIQKTKTEEYELGKPIPQLVTFLDEFNALMLDEEFGGKNPADANTPVLKNLTGVSEQARKAGIIIILGTQKIDAKSCPTKVRGNLKTKICLKVNSRQGSAAVLGDNPTNKAQGASLAGYGDGLVYNEDINVTEAIRFQGFYVSEHDMTDLINSFILTYGKNKFDYVKVNEEYATDSSDLEPQPIDYDVFKVGLPDILIVSDSIFLSPLYQKLLSELIRNPFSWDDKIIKLRYPSISTKDFNVTKQILMDTGLLAINPAKGEDGEDDTSKPGYLGLNLKMKGLESVLIQVGFTKDQRDTWDTENPDYEDYMMKLCLILLNRKYNRAARGISYEITDYIEK